MSIIDRFRLKGEPWTGVKAANTDAINQGLWSIPIGAGDTWPSRIDLYEGFAKDYVAIYRSQPAVRYTIDFIARNVAQVPLKAYRRTDEFEREALPDHPFNAFIKNPDGVRMTEYEFKRDLVTDLLIFDVTFWAKVRTPRGGFALVRLYPDAMTFEGGTATEPAVFIETLPDGQTKRHKADDVLWLHGYGSRRGISSMETLRRILAEDEAAGRHREGMYRNQMRQAGVIQRPLEAGEWSDTARNRFMEQMSARYAGGKNAGRPLILEEGMTWTGDQWQTKDAEYIADREFTMKAASHAYFIAPQMLGLDGAPYASISAYNSQLYQNTLAPTLEFTTQGLELQLLPEFNSDPKVYLQFNLEAKLRGSFEEQGAIITQAVGGPWMTPNEARALRELPPIDGGDELHAGGGGIQPAATNAPEPALDEEAVDEEVADVVPLRAASLKAASPGRGAIKRREGYAKKFEAIINDTFERQRKQAKALSTEKKLPDRVRWDRELAADLRREARDMVNAEGSRKAGQLGGKFDPEQVENYLRDGTGYAARNINSATNEALKSDEDADTVFDTVLGGVAAGVAIGLASHFLSFAREEAGKQNGAATKTWVVTNPRSRHPEMGGQQAPVGTPFTNGLKYPGDPAGSADATAHCQCLLDIE